MKKELKPEIKLIWDKLGYSSILNDVFVQNEFHKRGLKIKDVDEVTLCFRDTGKVHVHGHFSTESHSCEIAIMKHLIQSDIVNDDSNFIDCH